MRKSLIFLIVFCFFLSNQIAYGDYSPITGNQNNGLPNEGNQNTGGFNEGNQNSGFENSGDQNSGILNEGDQNTGVLNEGDQNSGFENSGDQNSGFENSGDQNSGVENVGNQNTGVFNEGNQNTGEENEGNQNTGDANIGDQNTGDDNIGDQNTGDDNIGDQNTGDANTGSQNLGVGNEGNQNDGVFNVGDQNTGDANTGSQNNGDANNGNQNNGFANSGDQNSGVENVGNQNTGFVNSGDQNDGVFNQGNQNTGAFNEGNQNDGVFNQGNQNTGAVNEGNQNTGVGNVGDQNTGTDNVGDQNSGILNEGNQNTGAVNEGNQNTGVGNVGDQNSGILNEGNQNTGLANSGDQNTGVGNVGDQNTGNDNTGGQNLGDSNIGNQNDGNLNIGSFNAGDMNTGDNNSGDNNDGSFNDGSGNVGDNNRGNDNVGDFNNGNNNDGDYNVGNGHEGDRNEDELEIHFDKLIPLFFGNYNHKKRVINLTTSDKIEADTESKNGYLYTKTNLYAGGLGAAATFNFPNAGDVYEQLSHLNFSAGIIPTKGKQVSFDILISDDNDLKQYRHRKIPHTADQLAEWKVKEGASFISSGGILFAVGTSYYGISLGYSYINEGVFAVAIQKISDTEAVVEINRAKNKKMSNILAVPFVSVSHTKLQSAAKRFSYKFDLSTEEGVFAYEEMLKGNIISVQATAIESPYAVTPVNREMNRLEGSSWRIGASIPIMPIISLGISSGDYHHYSRAIKYAIGEYLVMDYGIYMKRAHARIFNFNTNEVTAFYAGIVTNVVDKNYRITDVSGNFVYNYSNNSTSGKKIKKKINKLRLKTGLEDFLNIDIPKIKKTGNLEMNMNLRLDTAVSDHMMSLFGGVDGLAGLQKNAEDKLAKYIATHKEKDILKLCPPSTTNEEDSYSQLKECKRHLSKKVKNDMKTLTKSLTEMVHAQGRNNETFTEFYATIGKKAWNNRFLFQTLLDVGKICGAELSLNVRGHKIKNFIKTRKWEKTSECKTANAIDIFEGIF